MTLAEAFDEICELDAPLNTKLAAYAEKLRELNFPFAEAYDDLVARLYAGEVGSLAPCVGDALPPFSLPSKSGAIVSLEDFEGLGPLIVNFNRGHWCPFCKIHLQTIASYHDRLAAHGARVISIMPDRQGFLNDLREKTNHAVDILSDIDNGYALSLGLVMWVGEAVQTLMKGRGFHVDIYHGSDGWFLPVPATFVLNSKMVITARFVDPDFRRRMEIDDILAALEAQKHVAAMKG
jgi:peroxiredoxin